MLHSFPLPHVFDHAVVNMSRHDRYTDNNVNWVPLARDADGYRFRNEIDGEHEVFVSHREIYTRLASSKATIRHTYNAPENQKLRAVFGDKTFEDITGKKRPLALFREKLIKRYDDEYGHMEKKPRFKKGVLQAKLCQWRNEILIEQLGLNEQSRADQMVQIAGFPTPSVKTFRKDCKRYYECGEDTLALVHRHHGPGLHLRAADHESVAFAHKEAREYISPLKPSMAQVYRNYEAALAAENAKRDFKLEKIKRGKFEAIISKFDAFDVWDGRHGRASALKHFTMAKRGIDALNVGQRIEIDFWNVDLMSLFVETGMCAILPPAYRQAIEGKRIWFVAAIDVATRYILAFKASLNPNSVSAAAAIRMVMSDKRHISELVGAETPWFAFVQPRDIFSDNGKEFANKRVESVMRSAGITFNRPQAGKPAARPFIESLFHSIGPLIAAYFAGRTFGSIDEKGDYNPEHNISLLADEVVRLFIFAICDIYHNKPHSGLGGATPHNAWIRAVREHGIEFPSQDPEQMLHVFGERYQRRIGSQGIPFMGIPYGNEELHRQRTTHGQMVFEIKVDPENLEHIAVRGDKGWFIVKNLVGLERGVSLAEWIAARRDIRQQNASEAEAGLDAMFRAINRLRETGEAAALRANLTPRQLDASHYAILESDLFGAWEAVSSASAPDLVKTFETPVDPLRDGSVSECRLIPDYHAERERDARKKKNKKNKKQKADVEQTPIETPKPIEPTDSYYQEYR